MRDLRMYGGFMRRLPWALGLLGAALATNLVFTGCGSEDATVDDSPDGSDEAGNEAGPDTAAADAAKDGFVTTIDGGRKDDAAACKPITTACTKSTECCTANCDATSGKC